MQNRITVCDEKKCNGCSACKSICPKDAISIVDSIDYYDAVIDLNKCIDCGLCKRVCPNVNLVSMKSSVSAFQGWANDAETRKRAASGGIASELARSFIENGGIVCSCICKKGDFEFEIIDDVSDVGRISGSKYVKSNPNNIYKKVKAELAEGTKVLFIGLPCQVAAILNYVNESQRRNLYTVDLICHGTPSPKILDFFMQQQKVETGSVETISFRKGNCFSVTANGNTVSLEGGSDAYSIAFLAGLIYTENCYNCQFANEKRVSDITIGDSWGTNLDEAERKKGISLIICQSDRGEQLVKSANIYITDVDLENAKVHNHQLKEPSKRPKYRNYVMKVVKEHRGSFNRTVFMCEPILYSKQVIKSLLYKIMR